MTTQLRGAFVLTDGLKYACFLVVMLCYAVVAVHISNILYDEHGWTLQDAVSHYGLFLTVVLYGLSASIYLNVPVTILNILGMVMFNPFTKTRRLALASMETPFICFRVVTRGMYPQLVQSVTEKNLEICRKCGISNFKFEIVTDKFLNITPSHFVREIVVPSDYNTPNLTLFKARALHYSLDNNINILSADDWIVHLDEETLLTESVVYGIVNFITHPGSQIGQGVITYGGCEIENWKTTLMDGVRTAIDFGLFRFALQLLHRPVFGFKGSFIVVKMGIEADIGFDFGPKESIAEDLRFALTAWDKGYKFDFVDGIMQEKSTFIIADFVKQRKRWLIGHYHVIWNNSLPAYCKIAILPLHIGNLFLWMNVLNTIFAFILPVPITKWQLTMFVLFSFNFQFMMAFGNFMSLSIRSNRVSKVFICLLSQFLFPLLGVIEAYAALSGFYNRNTLSFDIVQKETANAKPNIESALVHV